MTALLKRRASNVLPLGGLTNALRRTSRERYSDLVDGINLASPIAQRILSKLDRLSGEHRDELAPWLALWHEHCGSYFDLAAAEDILSADVPVASGTRLFLAHSYCRVVLSGLVHLAASHIETRTTRASLFDWINCLEDRELTDLRVELHRHARRTVDFSQLGAVDCSDLLATVYQELLPPPLRHLLGEYYTPSWLVEHCISHADRCQSTAGHTLTVMDPAAGSGSFLAHFIMHAAATRSSSVVKVVGFDMNPLAVDFCHANTVLAISKAGGAGRGVSYDVSIHLADAVVDPTIDTEGPLFGVASGKKTIFGVTFSGGNAPDAALTQAMRPFHLSANVCAAFTNTLKQYVADVFVTTQGVGAHIVLGNPPWITWDGLTRGYREKVAPQWASSTLVTNAGWRAKVAAGKTDFSSLFVYRAAQRHAAYNAVMVFVLPLSLFQSHLAGAGFRTFRTAEGRSFALLEIDDFSDVKVFPDAVNRTSVGTFIVDRNPEYPIPYTTWRSGHGGNGHLERSSALGGPLDPAKSNSPLVGFDEGCTELSGVVGKSDYRARGGVNTGGANTILWLELLGQRDSLCQVRNVGKSRRGTSPVIKAEVERDAVYPLLCGTDMRRWRAEPRKNILLLYLV